ncbi:hypothetical protein [Polycladidibacter hongkongensis]|uniref:hypothetical protein n=1 Tax=Polycladidibacter hongkongensis TaxID=1647556 RepID=UPI000830BFE9|nr:hypothetical protein [Pseudovibrio hongkongensis]
MFESGFKKLISSLWQELGLGDPAPVEGGAFELEVDGVPVRIKEAPDGRGIDVVTAIGQLSKNAAVRNEQARRLLETNLATLPIYTVVCELVELASKQTSVQLKISNRGFNQAELKERIEDLFLAADVYRPLLLATEIPVGSRPAPSPQLEVDNAIVFQL